MSLNASLSSVSKTLGVSLHISEGKVHGSGVVSFPGTPNLPAMEFTMSPMSHSYNNQLCIMFHLSGDLHFLVSCYPATGAICIFMVDGSKFKGAVPSLNPTMNLKEAISLLGAGVVASYFYQNGSGWSPLSLK